MVLFDRRTGRSRRREQQSQVKIFPVPRRGLIRNEAYAVPQGEGAEVLDNFYPTTQSIRPRGGLIRHATVGGPVTHLADYTLTSLFATTATAIYDVTNPADPDVAPTPVVTGQTSGDYSSVQFTTPGGIFLILVNGADDLQLYDGTTWATINAGSAPIAITGVDTSLLNQAWTFKNRLFFIERNSLSAWYLPTFQIGGAAIEFPLGSVFKEGGRLLFGATWSLDSGEGLDDVCIFVTSEGEIAVYQGTDPASIETWSLVGVYLIGRPLGKNGVFRAGGDLAIATDDGIVPVSQAITQDRSALQTNAITYPIEELWRRTVDIRQGFGPFTMQLWQRESMLLVSTPFDVGQPIITLIANTKTGAWARYTGWDTTAMSILEDRLFIGGNNTHVYQANVSGSDDGVPYSCVVVPRFDSFISAEEKHAVSCRLNAIERTPISYQVFCNADWRVEIPPPFPADPDEASAAWGVGVWGEFVWGANGLPVRVSEWRTVQSNGYSLAPGIQILSGRITKPDVDLISLDLMYMTGRITG